MCHHHFNRQRARGASSEKFRPQLCYGGPHSPDDALILATRAAIQI
jgi:hypothetical protein